MKKTAPQQQLAMDSDAKLVKEAPEKQLAVAAPPPAQVETIQVQSQTVSQQQALTDQERAATQNVGNALREEQSGQRPSAAPRQALASGYAGVAGALKTSLLTYSLLKRDGNGNYSQLDPSASLHEGDAVRINAVPLAPGYLTLYERDSTGNWRQLFPASGAGIKVMPNRTYALPDSSIEVKAEQHFRLVLSPDSAKKGTPVTVGIALRLEK